MSEAISAEAKAALVAGIMDDMKAQRIETIDVRRKTSIADLFVVCTGTSDVHIGAISERIEERLAQHKIKPLRTEAAPGSGWVLQDFGDVIVHIMREERRQFYDLEALWTSMQPDPNLTA
jgi:ribosome-associated protein